jgi:hypothetical protein
VVFRGPGLVPNAKDRIVEPVPEGHPTENPMKKLVLISALALGLSACANQTPTQQRVTTGAAVGALGGAAVGAIANGGKGAAIGAVVGGIGGAAVAGATAPRECYAYDRNGNRILVQCP